VLSAGEQLDQPFLVGRARLRKLQRVAVELQPHRAPGPLAAPQPVPDRGHHRPQPLSGLAQGDQEGAHGGHADHSGTGRYVTRLRRGHILDIKLDEFRAQVAGDLSQPGGVCFLLG